MLDHDVLSLIFNDEIDVSHLLENLNTTLGPVLGLLANFVSCHFSQVLVLYMDGFPYSNAESWRRTTMCSSVVQVLIFTKTYGPGYFIYIYIYIYIYIITLITLSGKVLKKKKI
jgi:hypothetical protein